MALDTMLEVPMAKDRNPATATVKIDPELLRKAQQIVAFLSDPDGKSVKLSDYIDTLLRDAVERDHKKLLKQLAKGHPDQAGD